jgi:DinB family protein
MDSRQALKCGIAGGQKITEAYLGDLSDADLLVRALPGTNHIAWQLGHLIGAEYMMIDALRPGSSPKLPEGFQKKHGKETAGSDDPKSFLTKAEYLDLFKKQRSATLAVLDTVSDDELGQPAPEKLRAFLKTVADVFAMQGTHWVMHAGQWALIRRKLGRPPLF